MISSQAKSQTGNPFHRKMHSWNLVPIEADSGKGQVVWSGDYGGKNIKGLVWSNIWSGDYGGKKISKTNPA